MKHLFLLLFLAIALLLSINGCKKDDTIISPVTNNAPSAPVNPVPANNSTGIDDSTAIILSWESTDPDINDTLKFDVFVGTTLPLSTVPLAGNLSTASYNLGVQTFPGTTFYWQVKAKDNHGASAAGEVWQFTIRTRP
ncbi:MAG TPA: hypothetical protein PK605_14400 [Ignavibacteria bacterium]|nr:hypothetical protein [Ignavibacteria bacterium]HRF65224.1 hypothetical protein [Ignavibacteria bacterium]HRJ05590.1 hypothetical protein [Ignavibacteria bacterium]HRJ85812.1 hypothetical protein [Ignavibacteria bacterium]